MSRGWMGIVIALAAVATASIAACESPAEPTTPAKDEPPFGGAADRERAAALWRAMDGYQEWPAYPGLAGWHEGMSPHGRFVRFHVNDAAAESTSNPRAGSIIVKENYPEKSSDALESVTVMQKIAGYDPDNANWFWVKFAADGRVLKNPKGMSLAGRVAKGSMQGCIACHAHAGGGDLVYINDE